MQNNIISVDNVSVDYGDTRFFLHRVKNNADTIKKSQPVLHNHSCYELHIVKSGAYTFWMKSGQVTVTEQEMLLIKPKYEHYSYLKDSENSISTVIQMSLQKIEGEPHIFDMFSKNAEMINMKPQKIPKSLEERAEQFFKLHGTSVREKLLEKLTANEFVYYLLEFVLPLADEEPEISNNKTDADMKIMLEETLVDTNNSLSEISEILGYSKRQTMRLIKKNFGMTFTELQKYRNLENAKKLLQNMTDLSIGTVSVISGFKNESLFYKTFKKETGCTPGEYRKQFEKKRPQH